MKKLFWTLLLGNVVLFAAMQRGWLGWGEQEQQAQPALHGEMIRLLDASQRVPVKEPLAPARTPGAAPATVPVTPAPTPASASVAASPEPPTTMQLAQNISAQVAGDSSAPVCLEWGDFSGTDLARATVALAALQLGNQLSRHQMERDIGYWVYIPPLKNKAAVNKKIGELKDLGVREYFVVQNAGRWRNAISMGVFKTRDAAQNFLNQLRAKGVHSAQIGERASKLITTVFRVDKIDAATAAKVAEMQKDFPGGELKNVPCTH